MILDLYLNYAGGYVKAFFPVKKAQTFVPRIGESVGVLPDFHDPKDILNMDIERLANKIAIGTMDFLDESSPHPDDSDSWINKWLIFPQKITPIFFQGRVVYVVSICYDLSNPNELDEKGVLQHKDDIDRGQKMLAESIIYSLAAQYDCPAIMEEICNTDIPAKAIMISPRESSLAVTATEMYFL